MFSLSTHRLRSAATSTWQAEDKQNEWRKKHQTVDAAFDEYSRLRHAGQAVNVSEFVARYPSYTKSVRRMIEVYEVCDGLDIVSREVPAWPKIGQEFLGFAIEEELGRGALARVYLATELALGARPVVVKLSMRGGYEAETIGKLNHRNIVPVHSVYVDSATTMTAICMPYLGSTTLADVLEAIFLPDGAPPSRGADILAVISSRERSAQFLQQARAGNPPSWQLCRGTYADAVTEIATQLVDALGYTANRNILHRDLKPSNILITPNGSPIVLDFNLSQEMDQVACRVGGTLPYMAPEQIRAVYLDSALQLDHRADIFSLGVVLFEMFTGELPFGPPIEASPREMAHAYLASQRQGRQHQLGVLESQVDRRLAASLLSCLSCDPAQRPDLHVLAAALERHSTPTNRLRRVAICHRRAVVLGGVTAWLSISLGAMAFMRLPTKDERHFLRGVRHMANSEHSSAVEQFAQALNYNIGATHALYARGAALAELGKYDLAITDLREVQRLHPSCHVHEWLGYAYLLRSDYDKGSTAYHFAAELAEDMHRASLLTNEAYCLRRAHRYDAAFRSVSEAIALSDQLQQAYHLRSTFIFNSDQRHCTTPALAQHDIDRALELGNSNWMLHYNAAHVYDEVAQATGVDLADRIREQLMKAASNGIARRLLSAPWIARRMDPNALLRDANICDPDISHPRLDQPFVVPPDLATLIGQLEKRNY